MSENRVSVYTNENKTLKTNENVTENVSKNKNDSNQNNNLTEEDEEQIEELQNKIQNKILIQKIGFIKNKIEDEGGLIKIQKDKDSYKKSDCYIINLFLFDFAILTLNIISIYQIITKYFICLQRKKEKEFL